MEMWTRVTCSIVLAVVTKVCLTLLQLHEL